MLLGLLTSAILICAGSAADARAARGQSCKDVIIRNPGGSVYTRTHDLRAIRVKCGKARRVARARLVDDGIGEPTYHGFRCANVGNGIRCHRNKRRVVWSFSPHRR